MKAGLGLPDNDAWYMIETIAERNNIGSKQFHRTHANELDKLTPVEEYACPISLRLMYDPVVIASGETYERMWIQGWFDEGNTICPKTKKKLYHMALTPNIVFEDLILKWCETNGVSIPDPRSAEQEWSYLRGGLTTIDRDYGWINNIHHDIGTMSFITFSLKYHTIT
ncbi:U-box domain-containing protein [Vigna angularis]|uniref:U-box domain-containing protein n=1 Tax=Phaseolus angularis TaxID=3914 RepID=A0A8T0KX22_PHAAN|nr:U-box domain-containing protein [Vigna angularis]